MRSISQDSSYHIKVLSTIKIITCSILQFCPGVSAAGGRSGGGRGGGSGAPQELSGGSLGEPDTSLTRHTRCLPVTIASASGYHVYFGIRRGNILEA